MHTSCAYGLLAVGAALLCACSSISTSYDWDTSYDFSQLRSFAWSPAPADDEADPLARNRIQASITNALERMGYRLDPDAADFRVAVHFSAREKVDVVDWGYGYGRGRWHGGADVSVHNYTEGTLVVDMIENRSDELVWRGTATGVLKKNRTPEDRIEATDQAVHKLLSGFPPS